MRFERLARQGDELVKACRGWKPAVKTMREVRLERVPHHLDGIRDERFQEILDQDHLDYLLHIREHGVPSRVAPSPTRVRCRPHSTYLEHQQEGMQKAWKEMRRGR